MTANRKLNVSVHDGPIPNPISALEDIFRTGVGNADTSSIQALVFP
jgi:hypothetical protein